ncbi:MAG: hypothetical protein ACRCWQ_14850 [Bacilli bacterium]
MLRKEVIPFQFKKLKITNPALHLYESVLFDSLWPKIYSYMRIHTQPLYTSDILFFLYQEKLLAFTLVNEEEQFRSTLEVYLKQQAQLSTSKDAYGNLRFGIKAQRVPFGCRIHYRIHAHSATSTFILSHTVRSIIKRIKHLQTPFFTPTLDDYKQTNKDIFVFTFYIEGLFASDPSFHLFIEKFLTEIFAENCICCIDKL